MIIRRAVRSGALAIAAVNVQAWREAYDGLIPAEIIAGVTLDRSVAQWQNALHDVAQTNRVHVALIDDAVVGYVSSGPQRTADLAGTYDGEILALYVLAAQQRRGIARALIGAAFRSLANRDFIGAALWVLRDNLRARGFYEALGGGLVGEREDRRDPHVLHEVAYGWPTLPVEPIHQGNQ